MLENRKAVLWAAGIAALIVGLVVAGQVDDSSRPPLPKDTLPAKLSIDAVPLGLEIDRPIPEENPLTEAKVELGRRLFFDPILSVDRTVSCASCHEPDHGFAGRGRTSMGVRGQLGTRNAPSLFNIAYVSPLFWDGRVQTLEEQALRPIESDQEMGSTVEAVLKRLQTDEPYRQQFQAAFPDGITAQNLARAIASFERTLLLGNHKPDAFKLSCQVAGMNQAERQGMWLFESRGRCWRCHLGRNFTDNNFHNTGVAWFRDPATEPVDLGRFAVTGMDADRGKFKTPSLRGVARTGPYMHDGSLATLEEVVEFYNRGGGKNSVLDPVIAPLNLSADEVASIVAFLKALSEPAE